MDFFAYLQLFLKRSNLIWILFFALLQEIATWYTPSFVNVMCSTSWPTCLLIRPPSKRLYRGRGSHQTSFPAPAPRRLSPWRAPTPLCLQSLVHWRPVWLQCQVQVFLSRFLRICWILPTSWFYLWMCGLWFSAGIDKLTEKSQVSEDGTMVSVPKTDAPHIPHSDQSAIAGTSDTESNSGRDNEVSVCMSLHMICVCLWICM